EQRGVCDRVMDVNAQAEEGALLLFLHRRVLVRFEEGRVWIEPREHAVDRRIDELLGRDRLRSPLGQGRQNVRILIQGWDVLVRGRHFSAYGSSHEGGGGEQGQHGENARKWLGHAGPPVQRRQGFHSYTPAAKVVGILCIPRKIGPAGRNMFGSIRIPQLPLLLLV